MPSPPHHTPKDATFLHARREAVAILCLWIVCLVWTIGYSARFGYGPQAAEARLIIGLPNWVFWGVAVPWGLAAVISILFAVFIVADDDLGPDLAEPESEGNSHDV